MSEFHIPNALRQLYELSTHPGIQIDRWINANPDLPPIQQTSMVLPQLSLHTSGGPVVEIHPYGRQAAAQVYGTITATQEVLDSAAGSASTFPWVRFYARRFGNTVAALVLDSPTIAGSSVQITPAEFDEIAEIVDGWKEVTLRFVTAPTMGAGTNPQWRWSAPGETAGNRWEVLGAIAPALSGIPGNTNNLVPSPHQLSLPTYGAPTAGSTINLGWVPQYAPPVSATVDDQTSDATLIFAQDMPTITGFSAELAEQTVVGIGLDCGVDPCCIPTAIDYVELSWSPPISVVVFDDFERTEVSQWGLASSGQLWINTGGLVSNYNVANGVGTHTMTSAVGRITYLDMNWTDIDLSVSVGVDQIATGAGISPSLIGRMVDSSNFYLADVVFGTDNSLTARIRERVAGVSTTLVSVVTGITYDTTTRIGIRFQIFSSTLRMKVWDYSEPEPDAWNLSTVDTTFAAAGDFGTRTSLESGNTNTAPVVSYDNFLAVHFYLLDSKYEIQRMDAVEPEWKTIMLASDLTLTSFNDYEARVGILSSYRIRMVDPYDFYGSWSVTGTATVPEPGVTIGCDDGHLLIFTSNEAQDGSLNLAYSSVWEGRSVEEVFQFPEAGFVQLQAMYNRDFFTAFRTTERGGERFQRTVLVQAAAIAPETLADFTALRDMAWADVPYICVRDEDGNRWLATILVPGGKVIFQRRLYLAPIDIIEVTDTPSQVDP